NHRKQIYFFVERIRGYSRCCRTVERIAIMRNLTITPRSKPQITRPLGINLYTFGRRYLIHCKVRLVLGLNAILYSLTLCYSALYPVFVR
ncbi:MAG: hypothetical protein LBT29_09310, partial [Flavobacteriaceae bacterium]|nr:hypothetical protein [Flavobacteriaceae bacterium]